MAQSVQIKSLRPKHRELLRLILADPTLANKDYAKKLGVTPVWVSIVRNSDCFLALQHKLQGEIDSAITGGIGDQLKGVASQSLERLAELLPLTNNPEQVLDVMDSALDRLGYGSRGGKAPPGMQFNFQQNNISGAVPPSVLKQVQEKMGMSNGHEIPALSALSESGEGDERAEDNESSISHSEQKSQPSAETGVEI